MRLEVAKLIIFNSYGTETDQRKIYSGLLEMKKNASILSECPELLEILGYCSENGIGTSLNHDRATELYLDCLNVAENTNEKSRHGGKQRCLCRLVNMYMEDKNYKSALIYLEVLRPELDQLSQLPFPDAISQAHRMKYYIGRWGGGKLKPHSLSCHEQAISDTRIFFLCTDSFVLYMYIYRIYFALRTWRQEIRTTRYCLVNDCSR